MRARPVGPVSRLIKWARRRPAQAGLAAALMVVAGLAVFAFFREPSTVSVQRPPPAPAFKFDPPLSDEEVAANRRAAEWFLAMTDGEKKVFPMNNVDIRTERGLLIKIERAQDLPSGKWVIEAIDFDDWIQTAVIVPTMEDDFIRITQPLTRLREFYLRRLPCHSRCFAFLARNPGLESVRILRAPIDDAVLEHLKDLKRIQVLAFTGGQHSSGFTGIGLERLACLPVLQRLDLSFTAITDASAGGIRACHALTYLNLVETAITDATAQRLRDHPHLRVLHLDRTQVTDAALSDLGAIATLDELHVRCQGVTVEALAQFREEHPRCKVVP